MSEISVNESMRIDIWLWCIRAFRTRSKSTAACKASHIRMNGQVIKPASPIRVGDEVTIEYPRLKRTLKVVALLPKRLGAPIAIKHYEDLTPESEYENLRTQTLAQSIIKRDRGAGRPTKKDRRELEKWLEDWNEEEY
mgnify:CR=1 FL=1